jgi:hypothetical protein
VFRILFVLFLLSLKSDAVECDWSPVEKDKYGCVSFFWYRRAEEFKCSNMPDCFKFEMAEEIKKVEPPKKKEFFAKESLEEKKKIIPILDSSAIALLKNSKLKNIKIIFYNNGKLSKEFAKEAEQYILDKGVKREQFIIEIK